MNKTYRFDHVGFFNRSVYRLSRSIPKRSAYKVFFRKSRATKGMFLADAPANLLYRKQNSKRYAFYYHAYRKEEKTNANQRVIY